MGKEDKNLKYEAPMLKVFDYNLQASVVRGDSGYETVEPLDPDTGLPDE